MGDFPFNHFVDVSIIFQHFDKRLRGRQQESDENEDSDPGAEAADKIMLNEAARILADFVLEQEQPKSLQAAAL